jgi:hypothetical protein
MVVCVVAHVGYRNVSYAELYVPKYQHATDAAQTICTYKQRGVGGGKWTDAFFPHDCPSGRDQNQNLGALNCTLE